MSFFPYSLSAKMLYNMIAVSRLEPHQKNELRA